MEREGTLEKKKDGVLRHMFNHLWKTIVAGVLVVVPFYATYHIIRFLFLYIDGLSQPVVKSIVGHRVGGVGFVLTFLLLYVLGVFAANVFGRSLLKWFEGLLLRAPLVKNVYATIKETVGILSFPGKQKFKRVILVEYPRKGIYAIGFVTGSTLSPEGKKLLSVMVSNPPNPATGNIVYVPEEDAMETNLTIEEAVKIVVSGGILTPKEITKPSAAGGRV